MRAVVQRVDVATVMVDNKEISKINKGLLAFVGIEKDDTEKDYIYIARKITGLRIFNDIDGKFNLSVEDINGEILVVSQFTICGDVRRGKRPSFTDAMEVKKAEVEFKKFVNILKKESSVKIECGKFQASMKIHLINNGPVTILLDSKKHF